MSNEKQELKKSKYELDEPTPTLGEGIKPKMREIIIQTDGNNINIIKNETAGNLELIAILSSILNKINQPK